MSNPWVVIPTYNERQNIEKMIAALFALPISNLTVLIVDDSSPDGTGKVVQQLQKQYARLQLTTQPKKSGLGRAYLHGFKQALTAGASAIVQMDADFSHDPSDIPRLLAELVSRDMVIGSRYIHGIRVMNWPLRRLFLSTGANFYARLVTGLPFHDVTGGFRAWRAETLRATNIASIKADGYGFQIVMAHRAWKQAMSIGEIPIVFTERRLGQSKMSKSIMWEAFWLVWKLRLLG